MPKNLTFPTVVADYCISHQIKPNVKALCNAIIVAVDHSKLLGFSLEVNALN